ncbi:MULTISPECIES: cation diffusion facilitator family transporter [Halorhodospira]|uniref:cation diffusion facilitator family transporter n=1 Tax=Halorhodospira TaxID=85108 RepID=UPI001912B92C|nr:cation transporter [Halorhodospira halophila]MCG5532595.1 cation diffusion facilitator family transporter [Halorhodospira sp. 9621]MCG5539011.1 cation diffusion facilitator family transporter [Halorhodospira sp. 9622]MCG5541689.1 cation diffusion facilitator family transporter [Halorhodospira sp. M39old]MCG5544403.1 cation diffusion facilitator family transporter [Halorhodospira sp. 9628]MCG5546687.1 cation diffusion facilitator family transporter [Halorhodospira sp. M38]
MSASRATRTAEDPARAKRRVTLIGGVINLFLGSGKIVAGWLGQSQALVVDGVHSLSDLASDALVYVAATYGSQEADSDHPYGHARIETAATAGIGAVLLLVAAGFIYDAVQRLLVAPESLWVPGWLALGAALASLVIKEGLYHYTRWVANRAHSNLIHANAWHHRSDALSSVVVIGGIIGVFLGLPWLDAVAAIVVALMLAHVGIRFAWRSVCELVDTGLDPEQVARIEGLVGEIDGVRDVHGLRSRHMAEEALIDLHIQVDPRLSVSEGHRISEAVRRRLIEDIGVVTEVLVHVDHEPPHWDEATAALPLRSKVERDLQTAWSGIQGGDSVERVDLHYMEGRLEVELHLPWGPDCDTTALHQRATQLAAAAEGLAYVSACRVHFIGR